MERVQDNANEIGPRGAHQDTAILERMENFYNIIDSRNNISYIIYHIFI